MSVVATWSDGGLVRKVPSMLWPLVVFGISLHLK
jgi:hypothetical protein